MEKAAADYLASSPLAGILSKFAPVISSLGVVINLVGPYFYIAWLQINALWTKLAPYHPEEAIPAFFGLIMAFFGGHYLTTFAAIEAYRMCGYTQTKDCLLHLWEQYIKFNEENKKDNLLDENNDGVPDVQQITQKELMTRKMSVFLKSIDPQIVSSALNGLWMGFMGVVAVLRLQFAQTIALGATIGSVFQSVTDTLLTPILQRTFPQEYHKWIPVIISYFCRAVGVSIAWNVQRVISAFYSGIRGGQMFTMALIDLSRKRNMSTFTQDSFLYSIFVTVIAFLGFTWQVRSGFSLPFVLSVLLFPLTIVEYLLTWVVAVEH